VYDIGMENEFVMSVYIYNNALRAHGGDHLKAAKGLIETTRLYPDAANEDTLAAIDALLQEALLRR